MGLVGTMSSWLKKLISGGLHKNVLVCIFRKINIQEWRVVAQFTLEYKRSTEYGVYAGVLSAFVAVGLSIRWPGMRQRCRVILLLTRNS